MFVWSLMIGTWGSLRISIPSIHLKYRKIKRKEWSFCVPDLCTQIFFPQRHLVPILVVFLYTDSEWQLFPKPALVYRFSSVIFAWTLNIWLWRLSQVINSLVLATCYHHVTSRKVETVIFLWKYRHIGGCRINAQMEVNFQNLLNRRNWIKLSTRFQLQEISVKVFEPYSVGFLDSNMICLEENCSVDRNMGLQNEHLGF